MLPSPLGTPRQAFQLSPDPTFYFDGRSRRETRRRFNDALDAGTAVVVLSGDIGAGKTMLLREALARLGASPGVVVASIFTSQLDSADLLRVALTQFGCVPSDLSPLSLERALGNFLACLAHAGQRALLTIDEAQNLSDDAFAMLGEWMTQARQRALPLQLCLVGQRELNAIMQATPAQALRHGDIVFCPIGPLDADEVRAYIQHRLATAGWVDVPRFTGPALQAIQQWTRGVPRKINLLCNLLLMHDAPAPSASIGPELVDAAIRTLDAGIDPNADPDADRPFAGSEPAAPAILCIAGGVSDYVKAAAIWRELKHRPSACTVGIVCAYAGELLRRNLELFESIDGARDVIALNVPAGPSNSPLLMHRMRHALKEARPAAVVVFDGSNAAFTAAALAKRDGIRVLHVGGGVRTAEPGVVRTDLSRLTDDLADVIYAGDTAAAEQLLGEGFAEERVVCVGSLLADTFSHTPARRDAAGGLRGAADLSFLATPAFANGYALVRLSHPANTDSRDTLIRLMGMLRQISKELPLVWPIDARVVHRLEAVRSSAPLEWDGIRYVDELPYSQFADLLCNATCVITDSWNLQEEASALGTPCVTIGTVKERDVTARIGSNASPGMDARAAVRAVWDCRFNGAKNTVIPQAWDGQAASRLAAHLLPWLDATTDATTTAA